MHAHTNHQEVVMTYRGMSEELVTKAYSVMDTIPDSLGWLAKNRARSFELANKLQPHKDIPYGSEECQRLDIYLPKEASNAPVLIDIHGGGWCTGSKNARAIPAKTVTEHGAIWVTIDYGFAPTYTIDQIIDHVRTAISWVYKNINRYGGDQERMFITGNSAGAHLAATALMTGWHEAYRVPQDVIQGAFCISGVYDMESMMYAGIESREILKLTLQGAKRVSPLYHLPNKSDRPIVLIYGQKEPFGYQLEANVYAEALQAAGNKVEVVEVKGKDHFTIMNEFEDADSALFKAFIKAIK